MSFKLSSPFKKHATPIVNMPMEKDVMGRADKRGNILINKDLKDPKQIEDTNKSRECSHRANGFW